MRALAPLFAVLASITTIFAAIVRLWWSKPKQLTMRGKPAYDVDGTAMEQQPKASPGVQSFAKWWLRIVVVGLTIGVLVILVVFVVRIINISS